MTLKTFTAGERLTAQDLNDNFTGSGKIQAVYTGVAFDGSGNSTNTYEPAEITPAEIGNSDYITVEITTTTTTRAYISGDDGIVYLKIETKDVGGAYSDSLSSTIIHRMEKLNSTSNTPRSTVSGTFKWVHTLTANEKTNGIQIKISGITSVDGNGTATLSNKQTIISTN